MFKILPDVFQHAAKIAPDKKSFYTRTDDGKKSSPITWDGPTWKKLYEDGLDLATGLIDLGLKPRQHVGLLADNREEWITADYGILMAGAADVPRGTDVTESEIEYILEHSDSIMLFVEHEKMLQKYNKVKSKLQNITKVIVMDYQYSEAQAQAEGVLTMKSVMAKGAELRASGNNDAQKAIEQIKPEDLFTIIYTSGTTGMPKGVMLTHSNMIYQVSVLPEILKLTRDDSALSILPVWHIFERVFAYIFISSGCSTYYTSVRTLGDDIKDAKPTIMGSAPRLWENIYQKISDSIAAKSGVSSALITAAVASSKSIGASQRFFKGQQLHLKPRNFVVSLVMLIKHLITFTLLIGPKVLLDAIVLKKLRAATGGRMRGTVSGGGALPLHIDKFYNDIGIPVMEGYGMTETAPVIACRRPDYAPLGCVGPKIPGCEVEIRSEDGTVLGKGQPGVLYVKGPQVMKGYYKNEEATKKVLIDGWMNTGDLAMWTFNSTPCIKITGRAKDTIVLFSGENVEPVPIENQISESPFIEQVMVVGQDAKSLGALVFLNSEHTLAWAKENALADKTFEELQTEPKVREKINKEIKGLVNATTGFKGFERVTDFRIIPKAFEIGDELTNLSKLKRHVITAKYKEQIDSIYK